MEILMIHIGAAHTLQVRSVLLLPGGSGSGCHSGSGCRSRVLGASPLCLTLPWGGDRFCLVLLLGWADVVSLSQQSKVARRQLRMAGMLSGFHSTVEKPDPPWGWCPQGSCLWWAGLPGDALMALRHHPNIMLSPVSMVGTVWPGHASAGTAPGCPWLPERDCSFPEQQHDLWREQIPRGEAVSPTT